MQIVLLFLLRTMCLFSAVVITETASAHNSYLVKTFSIPHSDNIAPDYAGPTVSTDQAGNFWYVAFSYSGYVVVRVDQFGEAHTYPPPPNGIPWAVAADSFGTTWVTVWPPGELAAYSSSSGLVQEVSLPLAGFGVESIATDSSGNVIYGSIFGNRIGIRRINGSVTEFLNLPAPRGVAPDSNGNVYFKSNIDTKIRKLNLSTAAVSEFDIGVPPSGIAASLDALWFVSASGKLGKILFATGEVITVTELGFLGSDPRPVLDKNGNVWLLKAGSTLLKVSPNGSVFSITPSLGGDRIAAIASSGNRVWFVGEFTAGYVEPKLPLTAPSVIPAILLLLD